MCKTYRLSSWHWFELQKKKESIKGCETRTCDKNLIRNNGDVFGGNVESACFILENEKRAASSLSVLALQRVVTGEWKGRVASSAQSQRRRPVTDEQTPQARLCLRRSRQHIPDRPRVPTQSVEECNCRHVSVRNFRKMRQNGEKSRLRKVCHPTGWVLQVKARQSRGCLFDTSFQRVLCVCGPFCNSRAGEGK